MLQYDIWILKFLVYLIALWLIPRYSLRNFTIRVKMGSIVWSLSLMFYIVMCVIQNRLMEIYILDVRTLALLSLALFFHLASVLVVIWLIYVGYRDKFRKGTEIFYGADCFKRIRILSRDFIYRRDFDIRGSHTKEKRNKVVLRVRANTWIERRGYF